MTGIAGRIYPCVECGRKVPANKRKGNPYKSRLPEWPPLTDKETEWDEYFRRNWWCQKCYDKISITYDH